MSVTKNVNITLFISLDDSIFNRETFINEICKSASREELNEFVEQLKRSCTALKTERISFINDKYPEVIDAVQILTQAPCLVMYNLY